MFVTRRLDGRHSTYTAVRIDGVGPDTDRPHTDIWCLQVTPEWSGGYTAECIFYRCLFTVPQMKRVLRRKFLLKNRFMSFHHKIGFLPRRSCRNSPTRLCWLFQPPTPRVCSGLRCFFDRHPLLTTHLQPFLTVVSLHPYFTAVEYVAILAELVCNEKWWRNRM